MRTRKPKVLVTFGKWEWFGEAQRRAASQWRKPNSDKLYDSTKLFYNVTCSCGSEVSKWIRKDLLEQGLSKSCGCYQKLAASERARKRAAEKGPGKKQHPLYEIWNGMHQRCYNPKEVNFNRYGGRGIQICHDWRRPNTNALENFASYMGERPEGHTIDRIDNDGNYEPGNVRWATMKMQADNRVVWPHCRITDLTKMPQNFGNWDFLGKVERRYIADQPSQRFYNCRCKLCETEHWVRKQDLTQSKSTKCEECRRRFLRDKSNKDG